MPGVNRLAELKAARAAKLAELATDQDESNGNNKRSNKQNKFTHNTINNKQDEQYDIEAQKPRKSKSTQPSKLKRGAGNDSDDDAPIKSNNYEIKQYMNKYDNIKKSLDTIKSNTAQLSQLKYKSRTASTESSKQSIGTQLNEIISSTTTLAAAIKKQLDTIKSDNAAHSEQSGSKHQMRVNLYTTYIRRFQTVMTDYNTQANAYKNDLQKRSKREIQIVDPTLSDAKIAEIVESGQSQDVIKQALVSDNLNDVINAIESRHIDILKLENQVLEIYELFRDLAVLVDLQQESLDVIETHIVKTQAYTEKAEKDLHEAEDYQKKARSKQCCCIMVLMVILVVILAPVLLTQVSHF